MAHIQLKFQIKRGIIDIESIEDEDVREIVEECKKLCSNGKNEQAALRLLPHLSFEWDWENGDGDASEYFVDTSPINFECSEGGCDLQIGVFDDQLVITATTVFSVAARDDINLEQETLTEWLDENSMYACGFFNGGWSYLGTDGDNVWLHSINGKHV